MTKFSETVQPERRHGKFEKCRKGHSMAEGDSNVRVRGDGKRVCRACESDRRRDAYHRLKQVKAGVPMPFTLESPYYDVEVYEHTSTDVLSKFYGWQKMVLDKAKENPKGVWNSPSGARVEAGAVIEILEREMPILYQHILSRTA